MPDGNAAYNIAMNPQIGKPAMSVAMAGLDPAAIGLGELPAGGQRVREVIGWVARCGGVRGLQIDATAPGIRPRELDRSARRDLAALLRRGELECSGVDVFIPPEHFQKSETVDRAVSSVLAAIDLAADISTLAAGAVVTRMRSDLACVCLALPGPQPGADADAGIRSIRQTISDRAARSGVRVADFCWPIPETPATLGDAMGIGIDPAQVLLVGADPVQVAARFASRLVDARLSDVQRAGSGVRHVPGAPGGRLDVLSYLVTLMTVGYARMITIDPRGLGSPKSAIMSAAAITLGGD